MNGKAMQTIVTTVLSGLILAAIIGGVKMYGQVVALNENLTSINMHLIQVDRRLVVLERRQEPVTDF